MRAASLGVLCEFVIKAWGYVKKENRVKSLKKMWSLSNAVDDWEDDILCESENATEFESPDPDWGNCK